MGEWISVEERLPDAGWLREQGYDDEAVLVWGRRTVESGLLTEAHFNLSDWIVLHFSHWMPYRAPERDELREELGRGTEDRDSKPRPSPESDSTRPELGVEESLLGLIKGFCYLRDTDETPDLAKLLGSKARERETGEPAP